MKVPPPRKVLSYTAASLDHPFHLNPDAVGLACLLPQVQVGVALAKELDLSFCPLQGSLHKESVIPG
eukprot:3092083-Rhodomonas_salina.5